MVTTAGAAVRLVAACQSFGFWRPPTVPCHTGFSGLAIYVIKASEERLYS